MLSRPQLSNEFIINHNLCPSGLDHEKLITALSLPYNHLAALILSPIEHISSTSVIIIARRHGYFPAGWARNSRLSQPLRRYRRSGIHTDPLGTPRQISDQAHNIVWRWDAAPFGDTAPNQDPDLDGQVFEFNLRFPGQVFDAETGMHYNHFRDYDPGIGRYIESDPAELVDGTNPYVYALNSPIRYTDPYGLWVKRCARKLGGPDRPAVRPDSINPTR